MGEIRDIIWHEFPDLFIHNELLMAHLFTENGALAEDRHGDNNCSLGMLQWNFCIHEGMKVDKWLKLHPQWADWKFQVRFYLTQMSERNKKYGNIERAIRSWNYNAGVPYLNKVKRNVRVIQNMLGVK